MATRIKGYPEGKLRRADHPRPETIMNKQEQLMAEAIAKYLPWIMSCVTIVAIELQGRKWPKAWALSLAGQALWFTWIGFTWDKNLGFLPMVAILTVQYARNHLRWVRESQADPLESCAQEGAWNAQEGAQERRSPDGWGLPSVAAERSSQAFRQVYPHWPYG